MGIVSNAHVASAHQNTKATKKLAKQQAEIAEAASERDAQVLEHLAYQSQVLSEIRDLLRSHNA